MNPGFPGMGRVGVCLAAAILANAKQLCTFERPSQGSGMVGEAGEQGLGRSTMTTSLEWLSGGSYFFRSGVGAGFGHKPQRVALLRIVFSGYDCWWSSAGARMFKNDYFIFRSGVGGGFARKRQRVARLRMGSSG